MKSRIYLLDKKVRKNDKNIKGKTKIMVFQ